MYCWNCGSKNPNENKFCGQCGKQLARAEDAAPESVTERATIMGNGSPIAPVEKRTNPLIEEPRVVHESVGIAPAVREPSVPSPVRDLRSEPWRPIEPLRPAEPARLVEAITSPRSPSSQRNNYASYSGPSVLGLGSGSSGSDYLLDEDDDAERSSGRGLVAVLILLVLAILVWKQWSVIKSSAKEYAGKAGITRPETRSMTANTPPPLPAASVTASEAVSSEENSSVNITPPAATAAGPDTKPQEDRTSEKNAADEDTEPAEKEPEPSEESEAALARTQPSPPSTPRYDNTQVELAQKYLQGKGVPQDCARGVGLLRTAARQPNPKAQVQLAALYATGKCVTQDRAVAYRWFAQAQELDPNNSWINRNLNTLWAGMTAAERRRAEEGFDRQD